MNQWLIMRSERVYRWLLKLYPEEFRQSYGEPLLQAFRDACREQPDRLLNVWVASLFDLLRNAGAERLEQMLTRRWLVRALSSSITAILYLASWFVLVTTVILITYFMLVPWDEGDKPTGSFATEINNFFESDFVFAPAFVITVCEIIAITRLTRRRLYSAARIYLHFFLLNAAVVIISAPVAQFTMIVIWHFFPNPEPFVVDPRYGATAIVCGLLVVGTLLAFFVRLAWRTHDRLPLTRRRATNVA